MQPSEQTSLCEQKPEAILESEYVLKCAKVDQVLKYFR